LVALLAIGHGYRGVAVVVAADAPLKAEGDEGGAFGVELAGGDLVGGGELQRGQNDESPCL
jgi:hypothetical protein